MHIQFTIEELKECAKTDTLRLHSGASEASLEEVESIYGKALPEDFKMLYRFSDGFETDEYIFNMIRIEEMIENKVKYNNPLYIAEYLIYSDMWELDISSQNPNDYQITNLTHLNTTITLTRSLAEFIHRFLQGGVFEEAGLYAWHDEVMKG